MPRLTRHQGLPVVELCAHPCESPDLTEQCRRLMVQGGLAYRRLIIDLTAVSRVNGGVLGLLAGAWTRLGARPGDVVLCVPDPMQREVFRVVHLDRLFTLCESRDAAARLPYPEPAPVVVNAG